MVAAYVIGVPGGVVTAARVGQLATIKPCDAGDDLHCIVHFATYAESAIAQSGEGGPMLCTNPLSWRNDGARVEAAAHRGAVPPSGTFTLNFFGDDTAKGAAFEPLGAPLPGLTWAACEGGMLRVATQSGGQIGRAMTAGWRQLSRPRLSAVRDGPPRQRSGARRRFPRCGRSAGRADPLRGVR
jgi:hypothetical protein